MASADEVDVAGAGRMLGIFVVVECIGAVLLLLLLAFPVVPLMLPFDTLPLPLRGALAIVSAVAVELTDVRPAPRR